LPALRFINRLKTRTKQKKEKVKEKKQDKSPKPLTFSLFPFLLFFPWRPSRSLRLCPRVAGNKFKAAG
jgi:hypothetical protein